MKTYLEKIGGIGAIIAAAACPLCFPKLALLGALLGLGAFAAYETQLLIAALVLVALAVAGHVLSYRRHKKRRLLVLALVSGVAVFAGVVLSELLAYAGLAGLLAASTADLWGRRALRSGPVLQSEITCPKCRLQRKNRCRPTPASFSTSAPDAGRCYAPSRATAAYSARTVR